MKYFISLVIFHTYLIPKYFGEIWNTECRARCSKCPGVMCGDLILHCCEKSGCQYHDQTGYFCQFKSRIRVPGCTDAGNSPSVCINDDYQSPKKSKNDDKKSELSTSNSKNQYNSKNIDNSDVSVNKGNSIEKKAENPAENVDLDSILKYKESQKNWKLRGSWGKSWEFYLYEDAKKKAKEEKEKKSSENSEKENISTPNRNNDKPLYVGSQNSLKMKKYSKLKKLFF